MVKINNKRLITYFLRGLALGAVGLSLIGINLPSRPAALQVSSHTRSLSRKPDTKIKLPAAAAITQTPPTVLPPTDKTPVPKKPVYTPPPADVAVGVKPEPIVTPSPTSSVSGLAPVSTAPAPAVPNSPAPDQPPASTSTTASYTSTNWSGYLATLGSYREISAAWTVPKASGVGPFTSADSTWIGIGGVSTDDLIQVGTQNIVNPAGQVSVSAFYELLPDFSQPIASISVAPGDVMTGSVTEISAGQWSISITDTSNGQSFTTTQAYASSHSSAEWIEEDPSFSNNRQIPFDNYNLTSFKAGETLVGGSSVSIAGSDALPVTMVNRAGQTISLPSAITAGGGGFSVTRKGLN